MHSDETGGRIVLPGGAGYLGRVLAEHFAARGREVVVLSRREREDDGPGRWRRWDGESVGDWAEELEGAAAVVNLAGRSVNCRYTEENRREIYASRLHPTRVLGTALARLRRPPPVWINSSSATIYRHALDRAMDEETGEVGSGFSVDVCLQWERALEEAPTPRTRKVALRTAIVMGRGAEVVHAYERIVRLGLGGSQGSGKQWVSWIHAEDFARAVEWVIEHPGLEGPVNCAAPNPLPNREFMRVLRRAYACPVGLPAAPWMLEIGARLLGTETELLLKSRRVVPARLLASGFRFRYPELEPALREIAA